MWRGFSIYHVWVENAKCFLSINKIVVGRQRNSRFPNFAATQLGTTIFYFISEIQRKASSRWPSFGPAYNSRKRPFHSTKMGKSRNDDNIAAYNMLVISLRASVNHVSFFTLPLTPPQAHIMQHSQEPDTESENAMNTPPKYSARRKNKPKPHRCCVLHQIYSIFISGFSICTETLFYPRTDARLIDNSFCDAFLVRGTVRNSKSHTITKSVANELWKQRHYIFNRPSLNASVELAASLCVFHG